MMYRLLCALTLFGIVGCGTPSFLITPVSSSSELEEVDLTGGSFGGGKIAVIPVEGMLANAKSGGFLQATENPLSLFYQQLQQAGHDDSVKAVVLRVNSPGGTVACSDAMYQIVARWKDRTHKPVVVHSSEICASGAYYLSCAADKIVVQPTTVIGSIGVIFYTFDATGTMGKIGLKAEAIKSAKNKDIGSPFKSVSPEDRQIMQGMVNEYFDRFRGIVKEQRHITDPETLALVTDGRVFSGAKAIELGLADQPGLLEDAILLARKLANAPKAKAITYKRPYAYGGSIYATADVPQPQASTLQLHLPGERAFLPTGFYYLWNP